MCMVLWPGASNNGNCFWELISTWLQFFFLHFSLFYFKHAIAIIWLSACRFAYIALLIKHRLSFLLLLPSPLHLALSPFIGSYCCCCCWWPPLIAWNIKNYYAIKAHSVPASIYTSSIRINIPIFPRLPAFNLKILVRFMLLTAQRGNEISLHFHPKKKSSLMSPFRMYIA